MTREQEVELLQMIGQISEQHNSLRNEVAALMWVLRSKGLVGEAELAEWADRFRSLVEQDQLLQRLKSFQGTPQ
jgi:hypothetical protein